MLSIKPDQIYFLPAVVTVAGAFDQALSIYETNILGSAKFFEALIRLNLNPKILIPGSAEEYGPVNNRHLPIKETQDLAPANPYGLSKSLQERLTQYYVRRHRLHVSITRTFHFTGPYQSPSFVISDFALQIARIESGLAKPVIAVGNLSARRDFTDIRDVVHAYHLIMNSKSPDIFNVCSGKSVAIKDMLDLLLSKTRVNIKVQKDPKKMRPVDVKDFRGDYTKLRAKTGWRPKISLETMVEDVLNYHRGQFQRTNN